MSQEEDVDLRMQWWSGPEQAGVVENPIWDNVADKLDRVLNAGGSVQLSSAKRVYEPREHWEIVEMMTMTADPGRFRLSVRPRVKAGEHAILLDWWQKEPSGVGGKVRIRDDEWDPGMICVDLQVAKAMFREFFDSKKITQFILDNVR
jgi:hypothetical protein